MSPRLRRWHATAVLPVARAARYHTTEVGRWFLWTTRTSFRRLAAARGIPVVRQLLYGLPAIAVVVLLVAGATQTVLTNRATFTNNYRGKAARAFQDRQFDEARIRYQRLILLSNQPEDIFELARCHDALGNPVRADEFVRRLAPEDSTGLPAAHIRRARAILAADPPQPTDIRAALGHLWRSLSGRPDDAEANALLGQLFVRLNELPLANEHLQKAADAYPGLALPLARLCLVRGDAIGVARWATRAAAHARSRRQEPAANLELAESLALLGKPAEAAEVLRGVPPRNDPAYRNLAGDVFVAVYDSPATKQLPPATRLAVLEEGLSYAPDSGALCQRLAAAAAVPTDVAAQAALKRWLDDPRFAAAGLLAAGIEAQKRDDSVAARKYLRRAYELDPTSSVCANNYAWVLVHGPDAELTKALAIIDAALGRQPDEPTLRDTRGIILVRLERWADAVRDLEFALPRIASNRDTHAALAQAYRGLNLVSMAEAQQRLADEHRKMGRQ